MHYDTNHTIHARRGTAKPIQHPIVGKNAHGVREKPDQVGRRGKTAPGYSPAAEAIACLDRSEILRRSALTSAWCPWRYDAASAFLLHT